MHLRALKTSRARPNPQGLGELFVSDGKAAGLNYAYTFPQRR